jgi:hypothetical protein
MRPVRAFWKFDADVFDFEDRFATTAFRGHVHSLLIFADIIFIGPLKIKARRLIALRQPLGQRAFDRPPRTAACFDLSTQDRCAAKWANVRSHASLAASSS